MLKTDRFCPRCNAPRMWRKVRPDGARASRFECVECGAGTKRIKHRAKKTTMPAGLYNYRGQVKEANDLWRRFIYMKAKRYARGPHGAMGECAVCDHFGYLQAMHLFPKGKYPHMRFDRDNGAPGCAACHMRLTNDHEQHRAFCIRYLGAELYERLRLRSRSRAKTDVTLAIIDLANELGI